MYFTNMVYHTFHDKFASFMVEMWDLSVSILWDVEEPEF